MIASIIGRALTPKLLSGVAVAWAASLFILWAFMAGQATSAEAAAAAQARGESEAACAVSRAVEAEKATAELAKAVAAARDEWEAAQAAVDSAAAKDRIRFDAELSDARARSVTLFRQLQAHIHANPLPYQCRLDAGRLRFYAEARRGAPTAAPADRSRL